MTLNGGEWREDYYLRRLDGLDDRLHELERWRTELKPVLSAVEQMLSDADFGRRVRERSRRRWGYVAKTAGSIVATAAIVLPLLQAFRVI